MIQTEFTTKHILFRCCDRLLLTSMKLGIISQKVNGVIGSGRLYRLIDKFRKKPIMITFDAMIGKSQTELGYIFDDLKLPFFIRVIEVDGEPLTCTQDLDIHRINVATRKGLISKVVAIG